MHGKWVMQPNLTQAGSNHNRSHTYNRSIIERFLGTTGPGAETIVKVATSVLKRIDRSARMGFRSLIGPYNNYNGKLL